MGLMEETPGRVARYTLEVRATEIWPTPPASLFREPPKKLATPPPKMVRVRPVTFWLTRRLMVRMEKISPPRAAARKAAPKERMKETSRLGSATEFS